MLRLAAIMIGACDKGLQAAYHRNHTPVEKLHQPWVDDCMAQVPERLVAVEAMVDPAAPYLMLGRLTQADITAFVQRLARFGLNVDTATETPRLHALARKLAESPPSGRPSPRRLGSAAWARGSTAGAKRVR